MMIAMMIDDNHPMMIDDIIMMTMMMRIIIFVILVATEFKVFNQDGLRIQCVLMVNAKLDPEELPDNTVQVSNINNNKNMTTIILI